MWCRLYVLVCAWYLASWAGVCPGKRESAGKRKSGKTRKGSKWLRSTLFECARAASRSRETHLSERYRQIARRRGEKKATNAVAHDIFTAALHMLTNGELYREAGPAPLRERAAERARNRAIRQLERLGQKVILKPLSQAA